MKKIDTQIQITLHEKAVRVLEMIGECDQRFASRIDNYRNGLYSTQRDYYMAEISLAAKDRLISYYTKIVARMNSRLFDQILSHSSN